MWAIPALHLSRPWLLMVPPAIARANLLPVRLSKVSPCWAIKATSWPQSAFTEGLLRPERALISSTTTTANLMAVPLRVLWLLLSATLLSPLWGCALVSADVQTAGSGATTEYVSYMSTQGAVGTGEQLGLQTETDRDILAKSDAMSIDLHYVYHQSVRRSPLPFPTPPGHN